MKICCTCKVEKSKSEFHRSKNRPDGLHPRCKDCDRFYKRKSDQELKERDPEAHRKRWRKYKDTYAMKHPDRIIAGERKQNLKKFGLTLEQYEEMFSAQGEKCEICGLESWKRLAVDHNHETGQIRALLCGSCNMALGHFEMDNRLERAVEYLARFKS